MPHRRTRHLPSVTLTLLLLLIPANELLADAAADFDALMARYNQQNGAGNYRAAERTAIEMRKLAEGPLRRDTLYLALALNQQACAVSAQGRYKDSEPLYKRALEIREKVLGSEHIVVAASINNLAWLYDALGRYKEAERYYKRSLAIREKINGPNDPDVALALNNLGELYRVQGRYKEAEPLYTRAITIKEKAYGTDDLRVATTVNNLALLYDDQGKYSQAEPLYQRSLAIKKKHLPAGHPDLAIGLANLAALYDYQGRYDEAEKLYKQVLEIREKTLGPDHVDVSHTLNNLATLYVTQARYAEAETMHKRALAIREKALGPEHPDVASSLGNLALLYHDRGRYDESEELYKKALAIREKAFGPEHRDVGLSLNNLGTVYESVGRYEEAEPLYRRALKIREKALGPDHPDVAETLNNLACFYGGQGRYDEEEHLLKRALAIHEKAGGPNHPDVALAMNNLAESCRKQGRYAEAEPLQKRALAIREKAYGPDNPDVAIGLENLALIYHDQSRYTEAEPLYERSLKIRQKAYPADHPDLAIAYGNRATFYHDQGYYDQAEQFYERSLAIRKKAFGPEHVAVASTLNNLGALYHDQGREKEAEKAYLESLAMYKRIRGEDHPDTAIRLNNLAYLYYDQDQLAKALPLAEQALRIRKQPQIGPWDRFFSYHLRARILWKLDRRDEAVADLRQALDMAERQRAKSGGAGLQRAEFFEHFTKAFEHMVCWQAELGNVAGAIDAMERSRARSLVDQMAVQDVDLLAGVPKQEAARLRQRERETQTRIAALEKQLRVLQERKDLSPDELRQRRRRIEAQLRNARQEYVIAYADIRNASPTYRLAVGQDQKPITLKKLTQWVTDQDALLLEYSFGTDGGYLLVVSAGSAPRLEKLMVDENQAQQFKIKAGPLTAGQLRNALSNTQGTGVLQRLKATDKPGKTKLAVPGLAALWNLLIPEAERTAILGKKYKRLIIVPDGQLTLLPFETLVVSSGDDPKYLLDVGPPIHYGPSATVLCNLAERRQASVRVDQGPVLTVGNPNYSVSRGQLAAAHKSVFDQLATRSRYGTLGGKLTQLPYSGWEAEWVTTVFDKNEIKATRLDGANATEANVRSQVSGRRLVHLACHGLADQSYGNFFGALALAQGKDPDNPANDGFLTLAEIYELDLRSCELAILSACDTNYGPEQRGEGVWALSRGFLVAGTRRVVASNWLVDDEAAASLVSYYCSILAKAERKGDDVGYAEALHKAKRWVRQQEKWKSPYYWGTFVLVGPD